MTTLDALYQLRARLDRLDAELDAVDPGDQAALDQLVSQTLEASRQAMTLAAAVVEELA